MNVVHVSARGKGGAPGGFLRHVAPRAVTSWCGGSPHARAGRHLQTAYGHGTTPRQPGGLRVLERLRRLVQLTRLVELRPHEPVAIEERQLNAWTVFPELGEDVPDIVHVHADARARHLERGLGGPCRLG